MHGGDIYSNKITYDFSVSLNPFAMPETVRAALMDGVSRVSCYPDRDSRELKRIFGRLHGIPEDNIVFGNGSSELLMVLLAALKPESVLIPAPSYTGYERAFKTFGAFIIPYYLKEEGDFELDEGFLKSITPELKMIVLCNPNNPTGRLIRPQLLKEILKKAGLYNITIVMDESYLPLADGYSGQPIIPEYENILESGVKIIRLISLTKIFSLPGVRLGYMLCKDQNVISRVKALLPEWNVSLIAQRAGAACGQVLNESHKGDKGDYLKGSQRLIKKERAFLIEKLSGLGYRVYPSDANFLLFRAPEGLYDELLKKEILIRDCSSITGLGKGFYRVGIGSRNKNLILLDALTGDDNVKTPSDKVFPEERVSEGADDKKSVDDLIIPEGGDAVDQTGKFLLEKLELIPPKDIEKRSFEIIEHELSQKGIIIREPFKSVVFRAIHAGADLEFSQSLSFSPDAISIARNMIKKGALVVTDTNMVLAGINKKRLEDLGGKALCFMADQEVAEEAALRKVTRASVSMERAAALGQDNTIYVIGNAPTALITLYELYKKGKMHGFIIGVPVGFVNVEASKELFIGENIPYIINRGRKGGSGIAAAIFNALLYGVE